MAPRRRQKVALVVVMGGMAALAMAGAIGAMLDDPPVRRATTTTSSSTTTTIPKAAALGEAGAELDKLTADGRRVTHFAVYSVSDPALPEGRVQTVEIWRKGNLFRSDVVERTGAGTFRDSYTSGGAVNRRCKTDVESVQTCETVPAVPPDLPTAFVNALLNAEEEDVELVATDDDIAGYVARCFEAEDIGELCLATDGIMLRLVLQGATVELTRIEDSVPDTAFDVAG